MIDFLDISCLEAVSQGEMDVHRPGVCADAQCCKITWLEELASESNTIQAQEDIMSARVMASNIRPKLYVNFGRFSSISQDS